MEMLQGVWKQHLRPRALVGYGVKIFLSSPSNYVTRSPGRSSACNTAEVKIRRKIARNGNKTCGKKLSLSRNFAR